MVDFRPFRALRYAPAAGSLADLLCPPYDVIDPESEQELLRRSPHNMVRLELAELRGPANPQRYETAASALNSMIASGVLNRDDSPAYYLLKQRFTLAGQQRERLALIGALRLEELGGAVLPHENTASAPKQDRLALMRAARANFSPLMALYNDPAGTIRQTIDATANLPPLANADIGNEAYACWTIPSGPPANAIAGALADQPVYIADGHHRYETALAYRDETPAPENHASRFVLMALIDFNDSGLAILPYYRVIHNASPQQLDKLRNLLNAYFVSRPAGTPQNDPTSLDAVVATIGQAQTALGLVEPHAPPQLLTPANDIIPEPDPDASPLAQSRSVEAFVIQEMLLKPAFGDNFPNHVAYVHNGNEAMQMIQQGRGQLAFFVKGLPPSAFRSIVGAGIRLPRKSTYFHPKLPSGLAINLLDGPL